MTENDASGGVDHDQEHCGHYRSRSVRRRDRRIHSRKSTPAVAAGVPAAARSEAMNISDRAKPAVADAARVAERGGAVCSQVWPYYEPACWRDDRGSAGKMRVVRFIVADRSVAGRASETRP